MARPPQAIDSEARFTARTIRSLAGLEERSGLHDHAVDAVAALHRLLFDERLLQRVRLLGRAEPFEGHHFRPRSLRDREHARADRPAVDMHGAGAALREPAAEARPVLMEVLAQRVEQRHLRVVDPDRALPAVEDEADRCRHETSR
jgi:hypothetical protein